MTIVFSIACSEYVIMGADAAVAQDFEAHREYTTGRKLYCHGPAIVTTWGARDANRISEKLMLASPRRSTIRDLAGELEEYLRVDYDPRDIGLGNVGYHIGGFDEDGTARLYHLFWEHDGYNATTPPGGLYELQDQTPGDGRRILLYNGRNDLAHLMVNCLLEQIRMGNPVNFDLSKPADAWRLVHFVLRFAAELTPEVGPPFVIAGALKERSTPISHLYRDFQKIPEDQLPFRA